MLLKVCLVSALAVSASGFLNNKLFEQMISAEVQEQLFKQAAAVTAAECDGAKVCLQNFYTAIGAGTPKSFGTYSDTLKKIYKDPKSFCSTRSTFATCMSSQPDKCLNPEGFQQMFGLDELNGYMYSSELVVESNLCKYYGDISDKCIVDTSSKCASAGKNADVTKICPALVANFNCQMDALYTAKGCSSKGKIGLCEITKSTLNQLTFGGCAGQMPECKSASALSITLALLLAIAGFLS